MSRRSLAILLALGFLSSPAHAEDAASPARYGVGPQYDSTHVYVAPDDVDKFVTSFWPPSAAKVQSKWWRR